ncbi:MAG: hypothetical protein DMG77_06670 [Acidobacteria bacterium]|nr:MAG: hypothetical protein DMG77_06670 [Acidobacteriota bacterium]
MSNVLSEAKKQQVIALGRLGWPLRRIEQETGVRADGECCKRVVEILAAILASLHIERADNLFGGPEGAHGLTS